MSAEGGGSLEERARRPTAPLAPGPEPLPRAKPRSCLGSLLALFSIVVGVVYVANPLAGIDFLPDNIPLFGNLDEAAATTMLVLGLQYLFGKSRRD